jgi:hypothetical protein
MHMDIKEQRLDRQTDELELSAEVLHAKVEYLEEVVCLLLMKNQALRMALPVEGASD